MPFQIVRCDLVDVQADALVLPSNTRLSIDGGTGLAVGKRAGLWRLRRACKRIGGCKTGSAVATPAFNLRAKHLIHAVGPVWRGTERDEHLLRRAYDSALSLAAELGCESVGLPLLSAGTYQCPPSVSLSVAMDAIEAHLLEHETQVTLVLYSRDAVKAGLAEFEQIESYIDDNYVDEHRAYHNVSYASRAPYSPPGAGRASERPAPSGSGRQFFGEARTGAAPSRFEETEQSALEQLERQRMDEAPRAGMFGGAGEFLWGLEEEADAYAAAPSASMPFHGADAAENTPVAAPAASKSLEDMLGSLDAGFSETLLALIDESGRTDADVYKRANITRQHFSKIRKDPKYRPTKRTAVALAVALELDLPATQDLLARAGYTLTHASKFDVIVEYYIVNGIYNTFKINEALYAYDQQLLG